MFKTERKSLRWSRWWCMYVCMHAWCMHACMMHDACMHHAWYMMHAYMIHAYMIHAYMMRACMIHTYVRACMHVCMCIHMRRFISSKSSQFHFNLQMCACLRAGSNAESTKTGMLFQLFLASRPTGWRTLQIGGSRWCPGMAYLFVCAFVSFRFGLV